MMESFCVSVLFVTFVGLPGTDDGAQARFTVHIFMDGRGTVVVSLALQADPHGMVTVNSVMAVVYFPDLLQIVTQRDYAEP